MSVNGDALVLCESVARTFGTGRAAVVALSGVNCTIRAGDRVALIGPSGSGKSTLLHLIAGLDEPTRGSVRWPGIGGRDQLRPGPIGVVFQSPSLLPPLDVLENVTLPLLLAGESSDTARRKGRQALERLDLATLATKLPEEISGGQAQRVAVARVLAGEPTLILADEPTGQLDHVVGAMVVDALLDAASSSGAALVISTHDTRVGSRLRDVWPMCDGNLFVQEGRACSA